MTATATATKKFIQTLLRSIRFYSRPHFSTPALSRSPGVSWGYKHALAYGKKSLTVKAESCRLRCRPFLSGELRPEP